MERQLAFLQLKPPCIELLHVTATLQQDPSQRKRLVEALSSLSAALQAASSRSGALDARLAEYVFVPVSQVLRISHIVPVRALELCLECISFLLRAAWGANLPPDLAGQLLILFTFMAKPTSSGSGAAASEELQMLALKCTSELFAELSRTTRGKQQLTATSNIPILGEAVLVVLERLTDSNSNSVKLQAVAAVSSLVTAIEDKDALASFLPRIVSSITKALAVGSTHRPSFRVLEQGLDVLALLFLVLLADSTTNELPATVSNASQDNIKTLRSASWLRATASQVTIALGTILKLRKHDKLEVRKALLRLCTTILQECRTSLAECHGAVVESMLILASQGSQKDAIEDHMRVLLQKDDELSGILRESLHGWILTLPRLTQSKDDIRRRQVVDQIAIAMRLISSDETIIESLLAENLRDSISILFKDSNDMKSIIETENVTGLDLQLLSDNSESSSFADLRLRLRGQDATLSEMKSLISGLAESDSAPQIAQELLYSLDYGTRDSQLATFWILVNLLGRSTETSSPIDAFTNLGDSGIQAEMLDNLYHYSLQVLGPQELTSPSHWYFDALALEVFALQARQYGTEFRAELTETLYPVLHCLGSSNPGLQSHAITCLNVLATSCGYKNASDLVIANADYIVNAVGLRLSYGDISPQAPQVLLMMMRLCGPDLLPYLDDLLESIFSALEIFHGYPSLVELLFKVLKGMIEEGVREPQLAILSSKPISLITGGEDEIPDVLRQLKEIERRAIDKTSIEKDTRKHTFPRSPWKETEKGHEQTTESEFDNEPEPSNETEESKPPVPQVFNILIRISQLTQHYLTSASPSLRTSLMTMLHTVIPTLAAHENSFLPLINTLWPVLIPRLQDPEAYVVANALDIMNLMCEHAGNFMRTRIESTWTTLMSLNRRTSQYSASDRKIQFQMDKPTGVDILSNVIGSSIATSEGSSSLRFQTNHIDRLYIDTPTRMVKNAFVRLLCSIAQHVQVCNTTFDDLLGILDSSLQVPHVQEALSKRNPDLVWLRLYLKNLE